MGKAFSLMTYNVHEAVGTDKQRNYDRIVQLIEEVNPDMMMLQEVDIGREDATHKGSFLFETIESSTPYYGIKGITMFRARSGYGNAIFTRNRSEGIRRHDISFAGREPRGVLECVYRIADHPIRLLNTHLGLKKSERVQQLRTLRQLVKQDGERPTLLAGDFNEWHPFSNRLDIIKEEINMLPARPTFPAFLPLVALDRIFYKGSIRYSDFVFYRSRLRRIASDHRPLVARFYFT